ncbi:MAG: alanine--tRNA ligase [Candidatus Omnitrophica bacterium]|nr:alanine--tRNA ligase [Candidatus Omnitrophota bacterium]
MTSATLRDRFLSFFEAKGHARVASDSLIPSGDPTVLFTSAGMNQFKDDFLGRRTDRKRTATCQKCLRTADLENVGKRASHHSFFEMLGHFSFGDYFKAEAIQWGWEFLTGLLPAANLWVSVYEEDEEAFQLWRKLGVPEPRIKRFGQKDNFWPSNAPKEGPNGPCGPCSEIYFDAEGKVDGPKSVEVWNLVFTQFDRQPDGTLAPLPRKNIDTGMGLERLARVVQGVATDYETDLFAPIVAAIRALGRGTKVTPEQAIFAERAIADHVRAAVFLLAEGLVPSNESRGYVLRMLIRRAHRLGRAGLDLDLGSKKTFLASLVGSVEQAMQGSPYAKELASRRPVVQKAIEQEEGQFIETLQAGTARLDEVMASAKGRAIGGDEAFKLYDTYGFPLELTVDIAQERGFTVDQAGFRTAFKAQQERSRAGSQFGGGVFVTDTLPVRETIKGLPPKDAQFVGYEALQADAVIKGLWDGTGWVAKAAAGQPVGIVLDHSPFYGEAGGQIGDAGTLDGPKGRAEIGQTVWVDETLIHQATVREGTLSVQETVRARVDASRRLRVARSHTAAHLLHWALRKVLGPEAVQAGSYVEVERVRFDFSSLKGLHEEQRHDVEALVNQRVRLVDEIRTNQMRLEEAKRDGALALFGEKYGGTVRVVTIGDYSKELCGGTHVLHTGHVGTFLITGESSIAAGTRRIEALVGDAAAGQQHQQLRVLHEAAKRLGRPAHEVAAGLEELLEQIKRLERERKGLQVELAKVEAGRLVAEGKKINGITLVTSTIKQADRELLAVLADAVRNSLREDGVVLLASSEGPANVSLVMATTNNLTKRIHAGQLLKAISPLTQGSGGGRPEFAQAGGKDPSGIPAALKRAEELVREALKT